MEEAEKKAERLIDAARIKAEDLISRATRTALQLNESTAHFTQEDRAKLISVEVKLDRAINDIAIMGNNYATKIELKDIEKRTEKLEDDRKWLVRLILGVVILAILSLVVISKI